MLRLHMPDGKVIIEPLRRTAKANGLATVAEARRLVARWELCGDIVRRADGGYTVVRRRPRPDRQRIAEMKHDVDVERLVARWELCGDIVRRDVDVDS